MFNGKSNSEGRSFMVYPSKLAENIHRIILDIDYDLSLCLDQGIRQKLVKAIYELRDLEQLLTFKKFEGSASKKVEQRLNSL
jgi:hypothetical protein